MSLRDEYPEGWMTELPDDPVDLVLENLRRQDPALFARICAQSTRFPDPAQLMISEELDI